ncbi:hypothetical protein M9H77_14725 [Catharanthus roseus]|uniref:Uncharacterized protein n=1 Tax=Catharanthus roseus TaxID=4058 RepID=A0ACC0BNY3_CATRO|nr:hypothetical protein M9H77_14725 [Catharanthus roseus]
MSSGSPIDYNIESGTVRLIDWNDFMTNIQLGMRFVDKVHAVSAVLKYSVSVGHEYRVLKMCRENGSRTDAYVPGIYSRQTYRKTYQANFHSLLSENFWRDVHFNLTFYPPNMKRNRVGNKTSYFRGKWIIEIRILPQYVVDVACRDIIGKIVITPNRAMYKFDIFLK